MVVKTTGIREKGTKRWITVVCPVCEEDYAMVAEKTEIDFPGWLWLLFHWKYEPKYERTMGILCINCGARFNIAWGAEDERLHPHH